MKCIVVLAVTLTKSNLGGEGFISSSSLYSVTKQSRGRNLAAGTEAEAMGECCLQAALMACWTCFLKAARPHLQWTELLRVNH